MTIKKWEKLSDRERVKTLLAIGFIPTWLEELLECGDELVEEIKYIVSEKLDKP